jgi:hypothetical protein
VQALSIAKHELYAILLLLLLLILIVRVFVCCLVSGMRRPVSQVIVIVTRSESLARRNTR